MIVDVRKSMSTEHTTLYITGEDMQRVGSKFKFHLKFLGVHISAGPQVGKSCQRLDFLRKLRQAQLLQHLLTIFYGSRMENL